MSFSPASNTSSPPMVPVSISAPLMEAMALITQWLTYGASGMCWSDHFLGTDEESMKSNLIVEGLLVGVKG